MTRLCQQRQGVSERVTGKLSNKLSVVFHLSYARNAWGMAF